MKSIRLVWLFLLALGIFTACKQNDSGSLKVTGKISHADMLAAQYPGAVTNGKIRVTLNEIAFGSDTPPVQLDADTIDAAKGQFTLQGKTSRVSMYSLEIEDGPIVPLINDESPIAVDLDFSQKDNFYSSSGSAATDELRQFIRSYADKSQEINKSMARLDSLKRLNADDSVLLLATAEKNQSITNLNQYLKDFLAGVKQPIVGSFVLGRAAQTLSQNDFEGALANLVKKFPEDASIQTMKTQYESFKNQSAEMERQRENKSLVGQQAPELVLPDANGKDVSLSSFRGKFVLVDFWASWCRPCREENPNVVQAYNRFKDKNFTILGVSLDRKKDDWLQAIRADHLNWTQVSDLAFWNSKAVSTFNFDGIPFNVLIDPQGKIIAESLRGEALTSKLQEVLQ